MVKTEERRGLDLSKLVRLTLDKKGELSAHFDSRKAIAHGDYRQLDYSDVRVIAESLNQQALIKYNSGGASALCDPVLISERLLMNDLDIPKRANALLIGDNFVIGENRGIVTPVIFYRIYEVDDGKISIECLRTADTHLAHLGY